MALATQINVKVTVSPKQSAREIGRVKKQLEHDARLYQQIITATWSRLGLAHVKGDMADKPGRLQKVQFESILIDPSNPELIWFKIMINRRGLFGWKSALPYQVRTADLIDPRTIYELEKALDHEVTVVDTPDRGVYIVVNRLAGAGGIPKTVPFRNTLEGYPADMSKGTVLLGFGERRVPHFIDLDEYIHILIAGSSKSGKSNMLNNLICSLMLFTDPDDLKFLFIDLKQVEFNFYKKAPHLYGPVITEAEDALDALRQLLSEMDRRTHMFAQRECKQLSTWNNRFPERTLPRIILVIDEFSTLMYHSSTVAKTTEALVTTITNKGRAVGIHVWVCTQLPLRRVVPSSIRANMPLIIAGRVQNYVESQVILGNDEASKLPQIPGRMLMQAGLDRFQIQAPFISDNDVRWAIGIARGKYEGILSMDNDAPQIIFDHLVKFLGDRGGALTEFVARELRDHYGIPVEVFKAFCKQLVRLGAVSVYGTTYSVQKDHHAYRIVAEIEVEQEAKAEDAPKLLPALTLTTLAECIESFLASMRYLKTIQPIQGPLDAYAAECIVKDPDGRTSARTLYDVYKLHCKANSLKPVSQRVFGETLAEMGLERLKTGGKMVWLGIVLSPTWEHNLMAA